MNPSQEALRHITGWLAQLADLTRSGAEPVTKSKLASYATMLGKDFPTSAFTSDSLSAVVTGHEFFPAFDVLRQQLGVWWRENRPASVPALSDGTTEAMSVKDRVFLAHWQQRRAGGWCRCGSSACGRSAAFTAGFVRRYAPAAWTLIERGAA